MTLSRISNAADRRKRTYDKDPNATLDYSINFSGWLESGESITASTWTVDGVTKESSTDDGSICTVWLSGGVVGTQAKATVHVVTDQTDGSGNYRTDDRTIYLNIVER